jgi:Na+-transporting methylmalonyl-CoA/oxaloacetate decarboxylase gamma subunit
MNPPLITYIGFVVAVLIILWAIVEMTRRYHRQRRPTTQERDVWLTVKPMAKEQLAQQEDTIEDSINAELQKRSKQNGHSSPSKNI